MEPQSGLPVDEQQLERWKELCSRAAVEKDGEKLVELTREINRLLEEQERRARLRRQPENGR